MAWVKIADRSTYWSRSNTYTPQSVDYRALWSIYYDNQPDITNNRTKIKVESYVQSYFSEYTISDITGSSYIKLNGVNQPSVAINAEVYGGYTTKLQGTNGYWINHSSDGTGSFTWQGFGNVEGFSRSTSVSTYTLPSIPRATTINSFTWVKASGAAGLSRLTCNWATAHSIDRIQYSLNGGAYTTVTGNGKSGSFNISGLTPNTAYSLKIKVRRADSQVETESSVKSATTYDIAKITVAPNNNIDMDSTSAITYTNPSGASLQISLYKTDGATAIASYRACSGTGYTFTYSAGEKTAFYNQIPSTKTLPLRFYLQTSDGLGNTYLHYVERTFEVFNANPTFTTWTYADTNAATLALTGNNQKIIKGYSNVKATITSANKMVAIKGATAIRYQLTIGAKNATVNYSPSSTVEMTINAVDNNVFNCYAIDSRGESTNVIKTLATDYINYTPISISAATGKRTDDIGTQTTLAYNGTFFGGSFGSVTNTIKSATYKFKKTTDANYTDGTSVITPTTNGNTFSFSGTIKGDAGDDGVNGFDATYSYNIQVTVTDELSTHTFNFILGSGKPNIAIHKEGVAINQAYDETLGGALQVNGPAYFNTKLLLDVFYPVGTIYETTSTNLDTTTKMAAHFGGTWEEYGAGRVLVAKSTDTEFDTIGETGGAKTHTLKVNEMPSHTHIQDAHNHWYYNTNAGSPNSYYTATYQKGYSGNAWTGSTTATNQYTGGGEAHNNLPPYIVVYRYRRTA